MANFGAFPSPSTWNFDRYPWLWATDQHPAYDPEAERCQGFVQNAIRQRFNTALPVKSKQLYDLAVEQVRLYPKVSKSGKWIMTLPRPGSQNGGLSDYYWNRISKAVREGRIGPNAKIGVINDHTYLICIYSKDFTDITDVERVGRCLVSEVGYILKGQKLSYKADVITITFYNLWGHTRINNGTFYECRVGEAGEITLGLARHFDANHGEGHIVSEKK